MLEELQQDNLGEVLKSNEKVIVQYGAAWCGLCKIIKPKFSAMAEDTKGVKFVYVDAEVFPHSREYAQIENLPTFAGFVNGKLVAQKSGSNAERIQEVLNEIINN